MLYIRFILSVCSLYALFSVGAAAPLFDQAPIIRDDAAVDQGCSDPEPQPDLKESGSVLQRRFNPPDYCKCTSNYLQCLAMARSSETCNEHYFSCLNKCPTAQAMASMGGKRARILGGLISGLADIISGTIGKSHHHKSSYSPSRSLPFLPAPYAVAGVYHTPKPKSPKKPKKPGERTVESSPSTPWPSNKREQDALETCGCESKYVGPDLASCLGMCFEDPTMRMGSTDQTALNAKRGGLASNDIPPEFKPLSDSHPAEEYHLEDDQSSTNIPSVDHEPNPDNPICIPRPSTISTPLKRVVKTSTCSCESKGYNWNDLNNCLSTCFKTQPKACVMIIPPGGVETVDTSEDEQHKPVPGETSRFLRRSLPNMPPPYAHPVEVARPGEKGHEEEHGSGVGAGGKSDDGLSAGVLLFFFGCSMTPLLVLVWVGRMYRGEKWRRVSRGKAVSSAGRGEGIC